MAGERLYLVKTPDGSEYEPVDENTLVRWAEEGKVTLDCKVRTTLVPNWEPAIEVPALKPILKKRLVEKIENQHDTFLNKVKRRIMLRYEDFSTGTNGLSKEDPAAMPTAEIWLRVAAGITDFIILFAVFVLYHLICAWMFANEIIVDGDSVFYLGFIAYWITVLCYYLVNISLFTQTPGQRFWGIYLVRNLGQDFWVGRVFFYFLFMLPFGIFTPIFVYVTPSGRSLQEILTKTRVVKIVFDENRRKRK